MENNEIRLVQQSFARVWPIKGKAAEIFYSDLFETAPDVRPLFEEADMHAQGQKLMQTLNVVVKGLDDIPSLLPVAAQLAERHVEYGVEPDHYDAVGASLIRTLEAGLGEGFTPEIRRAWTNAYATLAGAMIGAAYPPGGPAPRGPT